LHRLPCRGLTLLVPLLNLRHLKFLRLSEQEIVQGESARAIGNQKEVDKTKQNGPFATVRDRPKTTREVNNEVGTRHLSRQKKGDGTGKQPKADEERAKKL